MSIKLVAHRLLSALPQLVLSFVQLFLYFLELFITIPCYLKSKDVSLLLQRTEGLCLYFCNFLQTISMFTEHKRKAYLF